MVYTPAASDFDALAFGNPHPGTIEYIQRKFETLPQALSERGAAFMADARQKWDSFMGSDAMRKARAVKERLLGGSIYLPDAAMLYENLSQVQNAGLVMQRYIMSEPTVRKLYHEQRIDGYSTTYVDPQPGRIGEEDYNYRQVMQGAVVDTEDGGWVCRTWVDDVAEGEVALKFDERSSIRGTWDLVRWYVEQGKDDPTSSEGGMM
ncbi:MAG: hypothetical protein P4L77_10985 [Sulfuriferula sp.]|nr:hypothetical protein [Sulfuriferula sp.]